LKPPLRFSHVIYQLRARRQPADLHRPERLSIAIQTKDMYMSNTRLRSQLRSGILIALSGLLIPFLAFPPIAAAQSAKRKHAPQVRKTTTSLKKTQSTPPDVSADPLSTDVLTGLRSGQLSATATGRRDGRITLSVTNQTNSRLRVVLPPGLLVSGTTGQFGGGMGGMGGGMMGGMGGMGGGMGGMGGGMGGMGGMGGGMGGMGGGMMGGMGRGGGTMPSMMGMMMLSRLIMYLAGDYDSWDQRAMMMGMGGMGMGGMGMGGMGMGGMGGMGMMGGMRSVPPTGPLEATLEPHQQRHLPTTVVSMNGPDADSRPVLPAEGEKLKISGVEQWTDNRRTISALKRLAEAKAPQSVAQMVLWYVTAGASWDDIGRLSQGWGNASEIALARRFVADLDKDSAASPRRAVDGGVLFWEIKGEGTNEKELVDGIRDLWTKYPLLGLTAREGVPEQPEMPAVACRAEITPAAILVKLSASHPSGSDWVLVDRFQIERSGLEKDADSASDNPGSTTAQTGSSRAFRIAEQIAEGMVQRLVRVKLEHGPRLHGKETFRIKVINESSLILNGLAVDGPEKAADHAPSILAGLSLPPLKTLTVPASADAVKRLGLKERTRVVAADFSGF
jgi:hypothetical protein